MEHLHGKEEWTLELKLDGYKYALEKIKENHFNTCQSDIEVSPYICDNLAYYLELERDDTPFKFGHIEILFPELNKYAREIEEDDLGWWPLTPAGKKGRIKALKEIIKELENE